MQDFARKVSLAGGLVNLSGALLFSHGFTNTYLTSLFPQAFSNFGWICVMLWGLAYIAAGLREPNPVLYAVFALEKAVYGVSWIWWMLAFGAQMPTVFQTSATTGAFFALYGIIDWSFGFCFARIAWRSRRAG